MNATDDTRAEPEHTVLFVGERPVTAGEFLRVLEDGNDPDLQAVDLTAILRNEVEKARSAHDEASITVTEEYEGALRVAATELLSSVFIPVDGSPDSFSRGPPPAGSINSSVDRYRNIIKNAIVHNDKAAPEITVRVEADDEVCRVRIADNGPGVRPESGDFWPGRDGTRKLRLRNWPLSRRHAR